MTLVLPLSLALSILIAIGPELQHGLTSTLRSDASSLYAGAYGEGISKFPDLATWLSWGLDPRAVLVAILIVAASLYARTVFLASLLIGTGTFLVLTLADLVMLATATDGEQTTGIGVSIGANFVAGCAIGFAAVLVLKIYAFLWRKSSARTYALRVFPISVVLASLTMSCILYIILFFFFHPTSVQVEFRLEPPARGFFISDQNQIGTNPLVGGETRKFSIIPPRTAAGGAEATFVDAQPVLRWEAPSNGPRFDVKITLATDCVSSRAIEQVERLPSTWDIDDIRSLSLEVDRGLSFAFIDHRGDRSYTLDVERGAIFWLKAGAARTAGQMSVEAYVRPPSKLKIGGGSPLRFLLRAPLTAVDGQQRAVSKRRTVRLTVNGRRTEIRAGGRRQPSGRLQCRGAEHSVEAVVSERGSLDNALDIGILVEITESRDPDHVYLPSGGQLSMTGLAGSIEIFAPQTAHMSDRALGVASGISFTGNLSRTRFDGREISFDEADGLDGFGEFVGYLDGRGYEVVGVAEGLWHNRRRVNPTRWERLSNELQAALLAAIGVILAGLARGLWKAVPHLRKDEELFLDV